jgi:hypothetical protein
MIGLVLSLLFLGFLRTTSQQQTLCAKKTCMARETSTSFFLWARGVGSVSLSLSLSLHHIGHVDQSQSMNLTFGVWIGEEIDGDTWSKDV